MEPERVQALRDTKALYDEGILDEAEYKAKKKELLAAPPAKALDDCAFVVPDPSSSFATPFVVLVGPTTTSGRSIFLVPRSASCRNSASRASESGCLNSAASAGDP